jgi:hypothetical protein
MTAMIGVGRLPREQDLIHSVAKTWQLVLKVVKTCMGIDYYYTLNG